MTRFHCVENAISVLILIGVSGNSRVRYCKTVSRVDEDEAVVVLIVVVLVSQSRDDISNA